MSNAKRNGKGKRPITPRTRLTVRRVQELFGEGMHLSAEFLERATALTQRAEEASDVNDALIEVMDDRSASILNRLWIASFVMGAHGQSPNLLDAAALAKAHALVLDALTSGDEELAEFACAVMTTDVSVNDDIIARINTLAASKNHHLAVLANCALVWVGEPDSRSLTVLEKLPLFEDPLLKTFAALAIVRLRGKFCDAVHALQEVFSGLPDIAKERVMVSLFRSGADSVLFAPLCFKVLRNRSEGSSVRMWAAQALGNMAAKCREGVVDKQEVIDILVREAVADDCSSDVLFGTGKGLAALGKLGRIIGRLIDWVGHENAETRHVVFELLGTLGAEAEAAVPHLASRLRVESENEGLGVAVAALARIGPAGLPPLLDLIQNAKSGNEIEIAIRGMSLMGEEGVRALADHLMTDRYDERVHSTATLVVVLMGKRAAAAVNGLAHLLDTGTEEIAALAAVCLFGTGRAATTVIDSLVRRVAEFHTDDDVAANWCKIMLARFSAEAVPQVKEQLRDAKGKRRNRLDNILADLLPSQSTATSYLEGVRESVLRNFVQVGAVFTEPEHKHNGISIRGAAKLLTKRKVPVLSSTNRLRPHWTDTAIGQVLKSMTKAPEIKGKKILSPRGRRWVLTQDGHKLLDDARQHLRMTEIRRGLF